LYFPVIALTVRKISAPILPHSSFQISLPRKSVASLP